MKVILLGAGQVGASLAESLVALRHDVSIIDTDQNRLTLLQDRLDLRTVRGHCTYPSVLREAGCAVADVLIAVTDSDEANILACKIAYLLFQIPKKIARIRAQDYFTESALFSKQNLPVDVFINPDEIVTQEVVQLIQYPGASQVCDFANGAVKCIVVRPSYGAVVLGKKLSALSESLRGLSCHIMTIYRYGTSIDFDENTEIETGDEVFFIAEKKDVPDIMLGFGYQVGLNKTIMIGGGGAIGYQLAKTLEKTYQVKLIEKSQARCEFLAKHLDKTTVLCSNVSDSELLRNENIDRMDVYCAMTGYDEDNILCALQAKKLGAKQVMSLITRTAYMDLIEGGSLTTAISPQLSTASLIMRYVRASDVVNVYSLRRGVAEVIEFLVRGGDTASTILGKKLKELSLPAGCRIVAVMRNKKVMFDLASLTFSPEDHVIVFVPSAKDTLAVEALFQAESL